MALPPLAAASDLAAWVGQTIASDDPRAGAVLSAASALVRGFTGQTWTDDADALTDVPDDVEAIVIQVAARVWLNPSGAVQWTKGPFSERYADSASWGAYLTDTEKESLAAYVTGAPSIGIGTLSITTGVSNNDTIYVPTGPPPAGPPFPWYSADDPALG